LLALMFSMLTLQSICTPMTAGLAAYAIAISAHYQPEELALLVIGCYLASYFSSSILETLGYSLDVQVSILSVKPQLDTDNTAFHLLAKAFLLILFIWLPIGPPSGYMTGLAPLVIASIIVVLNNGTNCIPYLIIQALTLKLLTWAFTIWGAGGDPVIGLLIATAIPVLLLRQQPTPEDPGAPIVTDPIRLVLIWFATWITPGYTITATTATLTYGTNKYLTAGWISAAIEGWVLHVFLEGLTSGKSSLGDILIRQGMLDGIAFPKLYFPVTVIAIACFVLSLWLAGNCKLRQVGTYQLVLPLLVQGLLLYKLWIIPFVVVGFALHFLHQALRAHESARSIGLLALT
jgi:hypothetical protein